MAFTKCPAPEPRKRAKVDMPRGPCREVAQQGAERVVRVV